MNNNKINENDKTITIKRKLKIESKGTIILALPS